MPSPTSPSGRSARLERRLSLRQALVIGAIHGPAELLPVSSSAHVTMIPWLLGWDYDEVEPDLRKAFEVALHAGTAVALLLSTRDSSGWFSRPRSRGVIAVACGPPALAGYTLKSAIARRLGTPATIAAGLLGGSALMLAADRRPAGRHWQQAKVSDGLWLGVGQAVALVPGVSRAGATTAAARLLGFGRADAKILSDQVGLPVLAGAAALELARLRRVPAAGRRVLAAGAAGSLASTLAARLVLGAGPSEALTYVAYRSALAGAILARLRRGSRRAPPGADAGLGAIRGDDQGHAASM